MQLSPGIMLDLNLQQTQLCNFYHWDTIPEAAKDSDLALGLHLAYSVYDLTISQFQSHDLHITTKPDMTPVSAADLLSETRIREIIQHFHLTDHILGEEFGGEIHLTGRQWIIDPIDGTKNYIRGLPMWATLICLMIDGKPEISIICAPALHRIWWAQRDHGSYTFDLNNQIQRLTVSGISQLEDCSLAMSSLHYWGEYKSKLLSFMDEIWRIRGYGDFYIYCLVAEGAVDLAVEPEVSLWDLAAPALLVQEAGGIFTNLAGVSGPAGGSALAGNPTMHKILLDYLHS